RGRLLRHLRIESAPHRDSHATGRRPSERSCGNRITGRDVRSTMRTTLPRVGGAVTAALVAAVLLVIPPATEAACIGPTLQTEAETVDRGGSIHVTGTGWGDDCHDTGDPPAGEGVLGTPVSEIEIWIVQDEEEHLVAIGSADQHYEFTVDLPVPPSLDPGPIEIDPRSKVDDRTLVAITDPVIVSEAPPAEPSPELPVRFGEEPAAQPDTSAPPSGAAGST